MCPQSHPLTSHPPTIPHHPKPTPTKQSTVSCSTSGDHTPSTHTLHPTCPLPLAPTNTAQSLHHHIAFTILVFLAVLVLLVVVVVFTWSLCAGSSRRRSRARYKSVSKFFPFSYGQQLDGSDQGVVDVVMPEYGLPKSGQAEREMLLNESDEDEI